MSLQDTILCLGHRVHIGHFLCERTIRQKDFDSVLKNSDLISPVEGVEKLPGGNVSALNVISSSIFDQFFENSEPIQTVVAFQMK
ncbi:hypothetical protein NPIL_546671 [Nephila pilipes]|uniref:Uncharacterized protein n=1 Tax=Nephila pilipes TaxID=299642 RepID=A0A8X6PLF0_NEPPI|nr:hypothetical protein NPIL_546671 [Nephila pilipes]